MKKTQAELVALLPESSLKAFIKESECIGCTKCLPVCPVDAILGSSKQMHTVLSDECIGCQLCVAACPVDCIAMLHATEAPNEQHMLDRYEAHYERLLREQNEQLVPLQSDEEEKKAYVLRVLARSVKM